MTGIRYFRRSKGLNSCKSQEINSSSGILPFPFFLFFVNINVAITDYIGLNVFIDKIKCVGGTVINRSVSCNYVPRGNIEDVGILNCKRSQLISLVTLVFIIYF